jgi:catechol 2,3-dioxygenase-like lactoylglutathione lyase family enzyme
VRLFHYHLITSKLRQTEARYLGKLGFGLVARYGRIGDEHTSFPAGVPWEELDRLGFRLRLAEVQRGAVNVAVQPGLWPLPRLDHVGLALEEDSFVEVLERATAQGLSVQEHAGRQTFVTTGAGYRLEIHPPRDWIDELLADEGELRIRELHLLAHDPIAKAAALGELLGVTTAEGDAVVGDALVRFLPGGPLGRPELHAELFD